MTEKPRSFLLPLFLILLTCLAMLFISSSLHQQVADLQAQLDKHEVNTIAAFKIMGEQATSNDVFLVNRQDAIIQEVKRLGINQESLLTQSLELAPEELQEESQ